MFGALGYDLLRAMRRLFWYSIDPKPSPTMKGQMNRKTGPYTTSHHQTNKVRARAIQSFKEGSPPKVLPDSRARHFDVPVGKSPALVRGAAAELPADRPKKCKYLAFRSHGQSSL